MPPWDLAKQSKWWIVVALEAESGEAQAERTATEAEERRLRMQS